jgi:cyclophilin family peptidyl-prolyl cis-trans isomerase
MTVTQECLLKEQTLILLFFICWLTACNPKFSNGLRKKDLKKDVEMITSEGTMLIRLSDSTPLHRDNFLKLVKQHFYDSIKFHRVIKHFMIQAGDPVTKSSNPPAPAATPKATIPAEFREQLFHKKGVIAAARLGDNINPQKASSATQFYIVQGKRFTDAGLDSVEIFRLNGRKLPAAHRQVYKTIGGTPHLDQNYTVFGEVIRGLEVIDSIAAKPTTGSQGADKPLQDIRIIKAKLVRRGRR